MRILFERTGGLMGRKLQGALDSSSLPATQARRLARLVDEAHFFDLPIKLECSRTGADRFSYRVTIETEGGSHTVEAAETAVPNELRPLLAYLTRSLFVK